jgi:hypothetical protein
MNRGFEVITISMQVNDLKYLELYLQECNLLEQMPAWYFGCKYWYNSVTSGRVVNDVVEKGDIRTTL